MNSQRLGLVQQSKAKLIRELISIRRSLISAQCCTGSGRSRPRPILAHPTRPRPNPVLARSGGPGHEFTRPGRSRAGLTEDL